MQLPVTLIDVPYVCICSLLCILSQLFTDFHAFGTSPPPHNNVKMVIVFAAY